MAATKQQNAVERLATKWYPLKWSKEDLDLLVDRGKLTKAAYKRITGEDYAEHD